MLCSGSPALHSSNTLLFTGIARCRVLAGYSAENQHVSLTTTKLKNAKPKIPLAKLQTVYVTVLL